MIRSVLAFVSVTVSVAGCSAAGGNAARPGAAAIGPLSLAKDHQMLSIPAGRYIAGSTPEERAVAYDDFLATAGHDAAREHKWFDREDDRHIADLAAFRIDLMPVTQAEYSEYVNARLAPPPTVDEATWKAQGFVQDYASEVARFNWQDGSPPVGKEDHPVVLVTWKEADGYCRWRGQLRGEERRLPTASEYEKASRGEQGLAYPWGNNFDPDRLNSAVRGPHDTTSVGQYGNGASPYGMLDAAGNVFQWTSTPFAKDRMTVKGSAWDDYGGVGRGASRHGRPIGARHVIVGFRCAAPSA
jgi:formylglycine-generating enzyme required for sulfatase activity